LITDPQIASMRPGSVIVDLAVESGGNVEGSKVGEITIVHGVKIIGHKNAAGRLAADASALYSRNLFNLINAFWDKEAKTLAFTPDDEIVKGIKLTEAGAIVHERLLVG
jgi:H+-translocating NAD(P) transhydrogenase subunit alpha